jgi:hypothetical protein
MNGNSTGQEYVICRTVHINISEKWNVIVRIMSCVGAVLECQMGCVCIAAYHRLFSTGRERYNNSEIAKHHVVSHKHDRAEKHKSCSFARLPHELWRQRIVLSIICPLPSVRVRSRGFPQMGGCYLLKYNGGDSGFKISVLYWRCSLIRVSVIRGSSAFLLYCMITYTWNIRIQSFRLERHATV